MKTRNSLVSSFLVNIFRCISDVFTPAFPAFPALPVLPVSASQDELGRCLVCIARIAIGHSHGLSQI